MRTARELAHVFICGDDETWCHQSTLVDPGHHAWACDRLTAAIEARDGECATLLAASEQLAKVHRDLASQRQRLEAAERDAALAALKVAREALEASINHPDHDQYCDGCSYRKSNMEHALSRISELVPS